MSDENGKTVQEVVLENAAAEAGDTISIANDVVAVIAGLAAGEIKGVAGMSGGIAGGIAEKLGRRDFSRGVRVDIKDNQVTLDLYVIAEYGTRIQEMAKQLNAAVRTAVEENTGLNVTSINTHVQGISMTKETEEAK